MVRLKVKAHVVADSEYAQHTSSQVVGRKFIVIVGNPEEWHVGTLAQEVSRTYKRMYKQPLGQVKYLKDREDCDLDPEQLVSDVLLDEGKAASDGYDQEAVFVVVHEPGQPLRHDSVVDLSLAHYQTRPRPTPPRFPNTTSTLGKRTYSNVEAAAQAADKRSKLLEIPETQEDPVPTIERSPELIRNTQHEEDDNDVFDSAAESQEQDKAEAAATKNTQFPRTPSSGLMPNGSSSSAADKFKSSARKDAYAAPESDIEDSQMSPRKERTPENRDMKAIEGKSSQRTPNDVSRFDAQEALLPSSPSPMKPQSSILLANGITALPEDSDSDDEGESSDDEKSEPEPLKVPKARENKSASKATTASSDKKVDDKDDDKKRKREPSNKDASQASSTNDKKKQKVADSEKKSKSKLNLPSSPSRRTSGVVSELDSPGEQLSQSLWDTAKSGSLVENVKNALVQKPAEEKTKRQLENLRKKELKKKAKTRKSSSASSSRPTSSSGITSDGNPNDLQEKPKPVANLDNKASKAKTLAEKIKDAKAEAPSSSKSAPKQGADAAAKSDVPLPVWGSESKEPKTPATIARATYIVPPGMTEEEYLAKRAKHESTPQPPKTARSHQKKAPTPAPEKPEDKSAVKKETSPEVTKKAATVAQSAAKSVKNVLEKAPEAAKKALTQVIGQEPSDSEDEDSSSNSGSSSDDESSSDESDTQEKQPPIKKAPEKTSKPGPKAKPAAKINKPEDKPTSKDKDKEAMPPPTPKSTARRRESTNKKQAERVSPAASSESSSNKSSKKSSSSESPAPVTKPATKAKPVAAPAKKVTPGAPAAAPPKPAEKPASRIKQLREKYNSNNTSKDTSPAPSPAAATKTKKPTPPSDSESSDSESSSSSSDDDDSDDDDARKKTKKPGKRNKKGRVAVRPDPTIRDVTPESSDDDSDDE